MTDTALTPISQARQMLAEAQSIPEFRELHDFATAAKAWAKARGLGVTAENEATEIILRAERAIGDELIRMADEGLRATNRGTPEQMSRASRARWDAGLHDEAVLPTLSSLGIHKMSALYWQRLARIDDERFEAMIASVRSIEGGRLAKANFYKSIDKAERTRTGADEAKPTADEPAYNAFVRGAYGLIGWEVDDEGNEGPTFNRLTLLPDDQLRKIALLLQGMARAYNEARNARGV